MKKLIFIDNDDAMQSQKIFAFCKDFLRFGGELPFEYVNQMEIADNFAHFSIEKQKELIFDINNVTVTWSMYSKEHFKSLDQLKHFLIFASINKMKEKVYIDSSGEICKGLSQLNLSDEEYNHICNSLSSNYIITSKNFKPVRVIIKANESSILEFNYMKVKLGTLVR